MNPRYKNVASKACVSREDSTQVAQHAIIHVARVGAQTTLCGTLKADDAVDVSRKRVISCSTCRTTLNAEVQARVTDQDAAPNRYAQFNTQARLDQADAELIVAMRMRAQLLRNKGHEDLAGDMELAANRFEEFLQTTNGE